MEKKISVVVPTYRRAALLRNCVRALSVQDLDKNEFEIIVVSDGPDDETRKMLNELVTPLPFVQFISLSHNQGPAAARNAGWRAANAPIIAFTDDDCLPSPSWLSNLYKEYSKLGCPQYLAITGRVIVPVSETPTDYERNTAHLETADFVTANCACTKSALELIDGFDERFRYAWREDSDLEFRLLEKDIIILRKVNAEVVHPVRKANWGVSIKEQRKTMFNALLFKKYPSLFRKKIQSSPAWNYYLIISGFSILLLGLLGQSKSLVLFGGGLYLACTLLFIYQRLSNTSRSLPHVIEMVATSLVIPFLSVYWTLYGAFKYKVLYY